MPLRGQSTPLAVGYMAPALGVPIVGKVYVIYSTDAVYGAHLLTDDKEIAKSIRRNSARVEQLNHAEGMGC